MDIVTALSALGQAIQITKDLREIERGLDQAAYKSKIAELYETLAEVKMALTDAREIIHAKDQEINALKEQIDRLKAGDICPICQTGRLKIIASKPHPHFAFAGVQERTLACQNSNCKHTEKRNYDPEHEGQRL